MMDWNADLTSTRPYDDDEDGESLCQKGVLLKEPRISILLSTTVAK